MMSRLKVLHAKWRGYAFLQGMLLLLVFVFTWQKKRVQICGEVWLSEKTVKTSTKDELKSRYEALTPQRTGRSQSSWWPPLVLLTNRVPTETVQLLDEGGTQEDAEDREMDGSLWRPLKRKKTKVKTTKERTEKTTSLEDKQQLQYLSIKQQAVLKLENLNRLLV